MALSMSLLPQELVEEILSYLRGDAPSLRACMLASRSFYSISRSLFFSFLKVGSGKTDLSEGQLQRLLLNFPPEMASHVREISLERDRHSDLRFLWPTSMLALRRLCISETEYSKLDDILGALLYNSPALEHLELQTVWNFGSAEILLAVPSSLKALVLNNVEYFRPAIEMGRALESHALSELEPIHLESATLDGCGFTSTYIHRFLLDSLSRIVLSGLRNLTFITSDYSIDPPACLVLEECSDSLQHLEIRFTRREFDGSPSFFAQPITSPFPSLRSISCVFPSRRAARLTHMSSILPLASTSPLATVAVRLNITVGPGAWCDDGLPAMDSALSRLPSLTKVVFRIRIVNRGIHSIAAPAAFITSSMPLTVARGILVVERTLS